MHIFSKIIEINKMRSILLLIGAATEPIKRTRGKAQSSQSPSKAKLFDIDAIWSSVVDRNAQHHATYNTMLATSWSCQVGSRERQCGSCRVYELYQRRVDRQESELVRGLRASIYRAFNQQRQRGYQRSDQEGGLVS